MREFCEAAFSHVGLDWEKYVAVDPRYFRPSEVDYLLGDPSKARRDLGWELQRRLRSARGDDGRRRPRFP